MHLLKLCKEIHYHRSGVTHVYTLLAAIFRFYVGILYRLHALPNAQPTLSNN